MRTSGADVNPSEHRVATGSHFEAMNTYYRYLDRGEYTTYFEKDHEPYPDAWAERQRERCSKGAASNSGSGTRYGVNDPAAAETRTRR